MDDFAVGQPWLRTEAQEGAKLIEVDYEVLPALADMAQANAPSAPPMWDDCAGTICMSPSALRHVMLPVLE